MSRGTWKFRKAEVKRAIEAAKAAGIDVERVEVQDGKVVVIARDKNGRPRRATLDRLFKEK
jgi:hypothetical protein